MSAPDVMPAAFAIPAAGLAWLGVIWPTIVTRIPIPWRERFTRHRWVGSRIRYCTAHKRCEDHPRKYNERGVRLCMTPACDLYHGHPTPHYNIRSDSTWGR